jgi:quercetin dioxygenase-like cupin family protein
MNHIPCAFFLLATFAAPGLAQAPAKPKPATASPHPMLLAPAEVTFGACPPDIPPGASCAVLHGDPSKPGSHYAIRSKLPDGYRLPPHTHPGDEHLTILAGTFKVGHGKRFDEGALQPLGVGSFALMPRNVPHFAVAEGETIVQIHGVGPVVFRYVNPADDPRRKK